MTNKEAAKILRGMVDFDFRKKKNTALTMGWTALRDVDEAKQKIVELADTCDKLNTLVTKYREALDIAADNYEDAANCSYQKCPHYDSCGESGKNFSCADFMRKMWIIEAGIRNDEQRSGTDHHENV